MSCEGGWERGESKKDIMHWDAWTGEHIDPALTNLLESLEFHLYSVHLSFCDLYFYLECYVDTLCCCECFYFYVALR